MVLMTTKSCDNSIKKTVSVRKKTLSLFTFEISTQPTQNSGTRLVLFNQNLGDLKSIEKLLENCDVNAPDGRGRLPILYAVDNGNLFQLYLQLKSNQYSDLKILIGHAEVVKLLLEKGAKPSDDTLLNAAEKGKLIYKNITFFHIIQSNYPSYPAGNGKIIELLIQHGVNIYARKPENDKTALLLAIENGNLNEKPSLK